MSFIVPRALPFSLLAALVLAGCAEREAAPLKKGEKARRCGQRRATKNARHGERPGPVGLGAGKNL